jgi:hypothetical protein
VLCVQSSDAEVRRNGECQWSATVHESDERPQCQ